MRRDGDILIEHLARARSRVLLCAPFIKAGVLKRIFAVIPASVTVDIVTRWRPEEIAAGVSDLEVYDLVANRSAASLRLLDNLHAKIYVADEAVLAGSANLTATALGWCDDPNVEVLTLIPITDPAIANCLVVLATARNASQEERDRIRAVADTLQRTPMPLARAVDDSLALLWLPRLAAPERLFSAYTPSARERLTSSTVEAADHDLRALDIPSGLGDTTFKSTVAERFSDMPAITAILEAARNDLTDTAGADLLRRLCPDTAMSPEMHWQIVREWMTFFLQDKYEIAPQTFVTRLRPGAAGKK